MKIKIIILSLIFAFQAINCIKIDHASYYKIGRSDQDVYSQCDYMGKKFFGVFDGHGPKGEGVALLASKKIAQDIFWENKESNFIDRTYFAYENFNKYLKEKIKDFSGGSTAVTAVIDKDDLYIANVGDSRAVLSRNGQAMQLSIDHKPNEASEQQRIENLGGLVVKRDIWRVLDKIDKGGLAVSRALGDQSYWPYVIPTPHIKAIKLTEHCQFLILATDGIWDYIDNQEAVNVVNKSLKENDYDVQKAARDLVLHARSIGEQKHKLHHIDDMTVTLIVFDKDEQFKLYNMAKLYNNCKRLCSYLLIGMTTAIYIKKQLF